MRVAGVPSGRNSLTFSPAFFPHCSSTTTLSSRSAFRSPETTGRWKTAPRSPGSTICAVYWTRFAPGCGPKTFTEVMGALRAPGTSRTRSTASRLRPGAPCGTTVKSALVECLSSVARAASRVLTEPSTAAARPTVTSTGVAVAAVRRAAASAFCRTSSTVAPRVNDSGPVTRRTSGLERAGASSARATTSTPATTSPVATVISGLISGVRTTRSTPSTSAASPHTQRQAAIDSRSTAASRSASRGRTRPARQHAKPAPQAATSTPAANAPTIASRAYPESGTWYQLGAWPWEISHLASSGPPGTPSSAPSPEAAVPTTTASARTIVRI